MGRIASRTRRRFFSWSAVWLLHLATASSTTAHGVEISGGIHTNFSSDHREDYGNASAFSIAYSAPLSPRDVHLIIEVGYSYNSGVPYSDYYIPLAAATSSSQASYWFIPVTLGVQVNLIPERYQGPLGLYYGIGMITLFTGFEHLGSKDTAPTLGGMMEIRPQYRLGRSTAVWLRERISVVADAQYDLGTVNHSGASLQLGFSFGAP